MARNRKFRDGAAAVKMAERANQLTGYREPEMLDTLAAAYAEAGRFPEAIQTAQKAVDLASSADKDELAKDIESRMHLYQAGRPYRVGLETTTLSIKRPQTAGGAPGPGARRRRRWVYPPSRRGAGLRVFRPAKP